MADNICSVFGSKFLSTLVPINYEIDDSSINAYSLNIHTNEMSIGFNSASTENLDFNFNSIEYNNTHLEIDSAFDVCSPTVSAAFKYHINGYISKANIGVGRSDNDRQFLFCNGRPVDLPKFMRAINEVCS